MPISDMLLNSFIASGEIKITPFRPSCVQPNSYDLHLGSTLTTYFDRVLDAKKEPTARSLTIPDDGFVLQPGTLYLGVTEEYTSATRKLVPYLDGKSSVGRLGVWVHVTAGGGDAGFAGHWTLEIVAVMPTRIYAGMPIAQLRYEPLDGEVENPYGSNGRNSKYNNQAAAPVPSQFYRNWDEQRKSWLPVGEK